MSRLRVIPIVEGQGEESAVRILLNRLWYEVFGGEYLDILRPIRRSRSLLAKPEELQKAVKLARAKLKNAPTEDPELILILVDADTDPPCTLGPEWLETAQVAVSDVPISCVFAKVEFETWFVGAAESLSAFIDMTDPSRIPADPETAGAGKKWIETRFRGTRYSPTVDQPKLTAAMDPQLCRSRCPSFDKLCRELELHL